MLARSDLSGPLSDEPLKPFICGYALPADPYYVISRTWLAPEMPRPGCVWTHSILIPFSDLGAVRHVDRILEQLRRPREDFSTYKTSLTFENAQRARRAQPHDLAPWLSALYTCSSSSVWAATPRPEDLEPILASVWEQQWPRLRRSVSFCSAFLGSPESSWANLVGVPKSFSSRWRRANPERFLDITLGSLADAPEWVEKAADDATTPGAPLSGVGFSGV